jgi:hypothetical protein
VRKNWWSGLLIIASFPLAFKIRIIHFVTRFAWMKIQLSLVCLPQNR